MLPERTDAVILRTVPYGDSSVIASAFTRQHGLQSYMVKGARATGKRGQSLRPYLQPGALLELVVNRQPQRQLQYIREMRWSHVYARVLSDVVPAAVATYMIDILGRCLRQPEANEELFDVVTRYLLLLDEAEPAVVANLPLHFALALATELGFRPEANYSEQVPVFDLQEARFVHDIPFHGAAIAGEEARLWQALLQTEQPVTLYRVRMNRQQRRELLQAVTRYFQLHVAEFGTPKSPEVLETLF